MVLLVHLRIISENISKSNEDRGISALRSVRALESLLNPYKDREFMRDKENIVKKENEDLETGCLPTEVRINFALSLLSVLTNLMDRRDLLLGDVGMTTEE